MQYFLRTVNVLRMKTRTVDSILKLRMILVARTITWEFVLYDLNSRPSPSCISSVNKLILGQFGAYFALDILHFDQFHQAELSLA